MRHALPLMLLLATACSEANDPSEEKSPPKKVEMVSVTAPEVLAAVKQLDAKVVVLNFWQTT